MRMTDSQASLAAGQAVSPHRAHGRPLLRLVPAARWPLVPLWALVVVVAWLGLAGLATLMGRATGTQGPICFFRSLTSHPCPTCGTGRGAVLLAQGDVMGALSMNPLVYGLLLLGAGLLFVRLVSSRQVTLAPQRRALPLWLLGAALGAANWVYLILAGI